MYRTTCKGERTTRCTGGPPKKCGLWKDPVHLARKRELGDQIDAVRERMPKCVVKDVRARFPNAPGILYMGHKRE